MDRLDDVKEKTPTVNMDPKRTADVMVMDDYYSWNEPMEIPFPSESFLTMDDNLGPVRTLRAPGDVYWPHCVWNPSQVQRWLKKNAAWLTYMGDQVWITPGRNLITRLRNYWDLPALLFNASSRSGKLDVEQTMDAIFDSDIPWQYVPAVGRRSSRPLCQILDVAPPQPASEAEEIITGMAKHVRDQYNVFRVRLEPSSSAGSAISSFGSDLSGALATIDSKMSTKTREKTIRAWLKWESASGYNWSHGDDPGSGQPDQTVPDNRTDSASDGSGWETTYSPSTNSGNGTTPRQGEEWW